MDLKHYAVLARLFSYPDASFLSEVHEAVTFLKNHYPLAALDAEIFYEALPKDNLSTLEELYTRTFDVQAITTLDIGYVLFGDDYKRGEILSNLNREHLKAQNDCGRELADHLPNILRLLGKLEDRDLIRELIGELLAPALQKMIHEFDPARQENKNKLYKKHYKTLIEATTNRPALYGYPLKALFLVMKQDFKINEAALDQHVKNDFLNSIGTEMSVEKLASE